MTNEFIAEVCDHYPQPTIGQAEKSRGIKVACACADCFYCDNDGHEPLETAAQMRTAFTLATLLRMTDEMNR